MKLRALVAGKDHELQMRLSDGLVAGEIDGRSYQLRISEIDANSYLLINEQRVYECRIEPMDGTVLVHVLGNAYAVTIVDPKRLRSSQSIGGQDHGAAKILAPMPGKVVRVLVGAGDEVKAGAGVVVVEAMKMQNELKAPKTGIVTSIQVQTGATVNAGDVLAVIE